MKHYEEKGVDFYGDVDEDYDILLTKLEQDLFYYEQSWSSSERFPYRYVQSGTIALNGRDYRIQKFDDLTRRYKDMYLLDNSIQLVMPWRFWIHQVVRSEGVPCYIRDW